jgi:hypothetical protein
VSLVFRAPSALELLFLLWKKREKIKFFVFFAILQQLNSYGVDSLIIFMHINQFLLPKIVFDSNAT